MIKIEHGCTYDKNTGKYTYTVSYNRGTRSDYEKPLEITHKITDHVFVSVDGGKPEIGDFIVDGVLLKKDKPQVNSDWSKWRDKDLYGNP